MASTTAVAAVTGFVRWRRKDDHDDNDDNRR